MNRLALCLLLLVSARAFADDGSGAGSGSGTGSAEAQPPAPPPPPSPPPPPPEPPKPDPRIDELEQRLQKAEDRIDQLEDDNSYLEDKVKDLLPLSGRISGYVDIGFFGTTGNGAGTREDLINSYFPEYASTVPGSWVFMGDPLSTAVNSRGEPADTGESRAVTFDPIHSGGHPTFIVNEVNMQLFAAIGDTAQINASLGFVPRSRDVSNPQGLFLGDFLDVKLAYGEWRPNLDAFSLTLQAGKFDSVLGYEYRALESPDRIGITPSLICRYTCGHPIGVKARARFWDDLLIANVAVTNGSHFSEGFDFSDETDTNDFKTVAGRVSSLIGHEVEVGVSGSFGAQDWQSSNSVYQWHYGADVHVEYKDLEATAEIVQGRAEGATSMGGVHCDVAACLHYTGAYGLVAYHATNLLIPYARVDWRDAMHQNGASFVYISDLMRATLGLRMEIGTRVILKLEATKNQELGRIPQFPDDVLTSSLILTY